MAAELELLKAVWPLLVLLLVAFLFVWRNLGRKRNKLPAKDNGIDYATHRRSNWGDDGGVGDSD